MFDLRSKEIVQHYEAHMASVRSFSIHPSGTYLLSVADNS